MDVCQAPMGINATIMASFIESHLVSLDIVSTHHNKVFVCFVSSPFCFIERYPYAI